MDSRRREGESSDNVSEGLSAAWYPNEELIALREANQQLAAENATLQTQLKQKEKDQSLLPKALRDECERKIVAAKQLAGISETIEEKEKLNATRVIQRAFRKHKANPAVNLTTVARAYAPKQAEFKSEEEKYQAAHKKYQADIQALMLKYNPLDGETDDPVSEQIKQRQEAWEKDFLLHKEAMILLAEAKAELRSAGEGYLHEALGFLKVDPSMQATGKELLKLADERAGLQKQLGLAPSIKRNLAVFGGQRRLRYQLSAQEKIKIDQGFLEAFQSNAMDRAQHFFNQGANVNMNDPATGFPLLISIILRKDDRFRGDEIMNRGEWLLRHGANPNQLTSKEFPISQTLILHKGSTPLMALACKWKISDKAKIVADLILEKGGLIDAQNDGGNTALHLTTEFMHNTASTSYLVDKKARVDILNGKNLNALQTYEKRNGRDSEMTALLTARPALKI